MSHPDSVKVEQVDREAAADLVERYYPFEKGMARLARSMRGGHADTATFVQAFARHRIAIVGESA